MVSLRKIDNGNIWDIARLKVREDQEWLVTSAQDSIIEAWGTVASGGWALPLGIYDDDKPVGFTMFTFGDNPCNWNPEIAHDNYEVNRFLIDQRYQHMGYGKAAIRLVVDYVRTLPAGPADYCWIGYKPSNNIAAKLYASAGFIPTDMKNYDETIAVLKLR